MHKLINEELIENEPEGPPAEENPNETDSNIIKDEKGTMKYNCTKCDYVSMNKYHLKSHIQYKHDGLKFECKSCDYKATTKSSLKMHTGAKHEGRMYSCDLCDFRTAWRNNFTEHVKTHTN